MQGIPNRKPFVFGAASWRRRPPGWVHYLCFGGAAFAILLLAIGAGFWHQDAPGTEATCAICHVAHLTPLPGSAISALPGLLLVEWYRPGATREELLSPPILNSSPRAPPF